MLPECTDYLDSFHLHLRWLIPELFALSLPHSHFLNVLAHECYVCVCACMHVWVYRHVFFFSLHHVRITHSCQDLLVPIFSMYLPRMRILYYGTITDDPIWGLEEVTRNHHLPQYPYLNLENDPNKVAYSIFHPGSNPGSHAALSCHVCGRPPTKYLEKGQHNVSWRRIQKYNQGILLMYLQGEVCNHRRW